MILISDRKCPSDLICITVTSPLYVTSLNSLRLECQGECDGFLAVLVFLEFDHTVVFISFVDVVIFFIVIAVIHSIIIDVGYLPTLLWLYTDLHLLSLDLDGEVGLVL